MVNDGDIIEINIPERSINVQLSSDELAKRREAMVNKGNNAWQPENRNRVVSSALKAYAAMTTSASRGGVRDVSQLSK